MLRLEKADRDRWKGTPGVFSFAEGTYAFV